MTARRNQFLIGFSQNVLPFAQNNRVIRKKKEEPAMSEEHTHEHPHSHADGHPHHHENTRAVLNRMSRAIGHMESIKTMIEDGRDCSEVLIQIAAVRSAINNIGKIILEDHIRHCVVDALETGDQKVLDNLDEAINKFVK